MRTYATSKPNEKNAIVKAQKFFKTGKGEYADGDIFIGITMPEIRKFAADFKDLSLTELQHLLASSIHEERMLALIILVNQYKKASTKQQEKMYQFYVNNMPRINNWDLVDASASYITGAYLFDKKRDVLLEWAKDENLWTRRIAIISTHFFIKKGDFSDTLSLIKILLNDKHDLIHKAMGWMLREIGKKDEKALLEFLDAYAPTLPRTTLRYAIERLAEKKRLMYLQQKMER